MQHQCVGRNSYWLILLVYHAKTGVFQRKHILLFKGPEGLRVSNGGILTIPSASDNRPVAHPLYGGNGHTATVMATRLNRCLAPGCLVGNPCAYGLMVRSTEGNHARPLLLPSLRSGSRSRCWLLPDFSGPFLSSLKVRLAVRTCARSATRSPPVSEPSKRFYRRPRRS